MPRRGLDTATVVNAAASLADREGLEAVTLVTLARHLGVSHPALYNHVAGQDDLRRAIAALGYRELADDLADATIGRSRDEAVLALALAYRRFALRRPGVYAAGLRAPAGSMVEGDAERVLRIVYQTLAGYGLKGDDLTHTTRALRSALHGFIAIEAASGWGLPVDLDDSYQRMVRQFIAGLPQSSESSI